MYKRSKVLRALSGILALFLVVQNSEMAMPTTSLAYSDEEITSEESTGSIVDKIDLGNTESEESHNFVGPDTESYQDENGETARRALALEPATTYGGEMNFTMTVDPECTNYITARIYGNDANISSMELLIDGKYISLQDRDYNTFIPASTNSKSDNTFVDSYYYLTAIIPLDVTEGKTSVNVTLLYQNTFHEYGSDYSAKHPTVTGASRGIYEIYTHTNAYISTDNTDNLVDESKITTLGYTLEDTDEAVLAKRDELVELINNLIPYNSDGSVNTDELSSSIAAMDLNRYAGNRIAALLFVSGDNLNVPGTEKGTDGYVENPLLVSEDVIDAVVYGTILRIDAMADKYYTDPATVYTYGHQSDWGGFYQWIATELMYLSWLDDADRLVDMGLDGSPVTTYFSDNLETWLSEDITVNGETVNRKEAWEKMFLANYNYARTHIPTYSNQIEACSNGAYLANYALRVIDPDGDLGESIQSSKRFLYAALGAEPYLGNDVLDADNNSVYLTVSDVDEAGYDYAAKDANGNIQTIDVDGISYIVDENGERIHKKEANWGRNYYTVTENGVSRELNYVGSYGDRIPGFNGITKWLCDTTAIERFLKMCNARQSLSHSILYDNGDDTYAYAMTADAWIESRECAFPMHKVSYISTNDSTEAIERPIAIVRTLELLENHSDIYGTSEDHDSEYDEIWTLAEKMYGIVNQDLNDGWYYEAVTGFDTSKFFQTNDVNLDWFRLYWYIREKGDNGERMLLTQYDNTTDKSGSFVDTETTALSFYDQEDDTVGIVEMNYKAFEYGVNGIGRIHIIEDGVNKAANVQVDSYYTPDVGEWTIRENLVGGTIQGGSSALAGDIVPVNAGIIDDVNPNMEKSAYLGMAEFYVMQYGQYLIGMNTTDDYEYRLDDGTYSNAKTYYMNVPDDYTDSTIYDLISGEYLEVVDGKVEVPKDTAVVCKIGQIEEVNPLSTRFVNATEGDDFVNVTWSNASGAHTYEIYRAVVASDGSTSDYELIAQTDEDAESNAYTDTEVEKGNTYRYAVVSVSKSGAKSGMSVYGEIEYDNESIGDGFVSTTIGDDATSLNATYSNGTVSFSSDEDVISGNAAEVVIHASNIVTEGRDGVTAHIRLDNPNAEDVATVAITSTGSLDTYKDFTAAFPNDGGEHNVYIMYEYAINGTPTLNLNVDYIEINGTRFEAEDYDTSYTDTYIVKEAETGSIVNNIRSLDVMKYSSIDIPSVDILNSIGAKADRCEYAYTTASLNKSIVIKVPQTNGSGAMIRETLKDSARNAFLGVVDNKITLLVRDKLINAGKESAQTIFTEDIGDYQYLKLEQNDSQVIAYASVDGENYDTLGSRTFYTADNVYIGAAALSTSDVDIISISDGGVTEDSMTAGAPTVTATANGITSVSLSWTEATNAYTYNVYRSTDGYHYVKIQSKITAALSYTDSNVNEGTYYYYVTANNCLGVESDITSNQVKVELSEEETTPITPYEGVDMGSLVTVNGFENYDQTTGTFTITGTTKDIDGAYEDSARFVYQEIEDDGSFIINVEDLAYVNSYGNDKTGLMIRSSLDSKSKMATLLQSSSKKIQRLVRSNDGDSISWKWIDTSLDSFTRIKMEKTGDTVEFFYEKDGEWVSVESYSGFDGTVYIGMFLSGGSGSTGQAVISGANPIFENAETETVDLNIGDIYTSEISAVYDFADEMGADISYELISAPEGTTFENNTVSYTAVKEDIGNQEIVIRATAKKESDGEIVRCGFDMDYHIKLNIINTENIPVLLKQDSFEVASGQNVEFNLELAQVNGKDYEGPVVYDIADLPANAIFEPLTGKFSWTPTDDDAGDHSLTFTATGNGYTSEMTMEVKVFANTSFVEMPTEYEVNVGESLTFTVEYEAEESLDASFKTPRNLPSNAYFNKTTGVFEWTPTTEQGGAEYVITFVVNSQLGGDLTLPITIKVNEGNISPKYKSDQELETVIIGNATGTLTYTDGKYVPSDISGGGLSTSGDNIVFAQQTMSGDGSLTAGLIRQKWSGTNLQYERQGIMIRESLDPDSKFVYLYMNSANCGCAIRYREETGGSVKEVFASYGETAHSENKEALYKLVRTGNNIMGYISTNGGSTWTPVVDSSNKTMAALHISFSKNVYIGIAAYNGLTSNITVYDQPVVGDQYIISEDEDTTDEESLYDSETVELEGYDELYVENSAKSKVESWSDGASGIGSINNTTILSYSDISFDELLSLDLFRHSSSINQTAQVDIYYDLGTDDANDNSDTSAVDSNLDLYSSEDSEVEAADKSDEIESVELEDSANTGDSLDGISTTDTSINDTDVEDDAAVSDISDTSTSDSADEAYSSSDETGNDTLGTSDSDTTDSELADSDTSNELTSTSTQDSDDIDDGYEIDESKKLGTLTYESGDVSNTLDLSDCGLSGTHTIYLVINVRSGAWAGNYDYMQLNYSKEESEDEDIDNIVTFPIYATDDDGEISEKSVVCADSTVTGYSWEDGVFSWNIKGYDDGAYSFMFSAKDNEDAITQRTIIIYIGDVDHTDNYDETLSGNESEAEDDTSIKVESYDQIVGYYTSNSELELPTVVNAVYADGTNLELNITWSEDERLFSESTIYKLQGTVQENEDIVYALINYEDFGTLDSIVTKAEKAGFTDDCVVEGRAIIDENVVDYTKLSEVLYSLSRLTIVEPTDIEVYIGDEEIIDGSTINLKLNQEIKLDTVISPDDSSITKADFVSENGLVTISEEGNLVANAVGTDVVTVTAGDVSISFTVEISEIQTVPETDETSDESDSEQTNNESSDSSSTSGTVEETTNDTVETGEQVQTITEVAVKSVKLNKKKVSIGKGGTYQLTATVKPTDATNKDLIWTTSNKKVATVTSNGLVKAKKIGSATITVKTKDGSYTAKCKVTVKKAVAVTSVKLNKKSKTLKVGKTYQLKAKVKPKNATITDVTFKSSNKKVATVDSTGKVTAKKKGTTVITVTTKDGKYTATCKIKVK